VQCCIPPALLAVHPSTECGPKCGPKCRPDCQCKCECKRECQYQCRRRRRRRCRCRCRDATCSTRRTDVMATSVVLAATAGQEEQGRAGKSREEQGRAPPWAQPGIDMSGPCSPANPVHRLARTPGTLQKSPALRILVWSSRLSNMDGILLHSTNAKILICGKPQLLACPIPQPRLSHFSFSDPTPPDSKTAKAKAAMPCALQTLCHGP